MRLTELTITALPFFVFQCASMVGSRINESCTLTLQLALVKTSRIVVGENQHSKSITILQCIIGEMQCNEQNMLSVMNVEGNVRRRKRPCSESGPRPGLSKATY